jgi:hypothetical protein
VKIVPGLKTTMCGYNLIASVTQSLRVAMAENDDNKHEHKYHRPIEDTNNIRGQSAAEIPL